MAERQMRQTEQETRLAGIIFSPEVTPSHSLVDLCVNMLEQNVLNWIKPEECTSRCQEIQSLKKDPKVVLDASGNIKISSKTVATTCSVSSELDLKNALQRRSLAMGQARLCSFQEAEMWVQHLFLSHERAQPSGFHQCRSSKSLSVTSRCSLGLPTTWLGNCSQILDHRFSSVELHHTVWHYDYRKLATVSASFAVINTASKHLHNDLAKATEALEQKNRSWIIKHTIGCGTEEPPYIA